MTIRCEITSQDRQVFSGEVDMVVIPGAAGQMGILPHHSPVLTALSFGIIVVKTKNEEFHFTVAGGIAEVQPDQVTILADAAENVMEIDIERALEARKSAEEKLKTTITADTDRYMKITSSLRRSNLRLQAVKKYRKDGKSII
jgi:F-type H+-transporting ATPase subunit epsilon